MSKLNDVSNPDGDARSSARVGHVNLKVADLDRALAFYEGVLGLTVTKRLGNVAAFLAFGKYHHDVCLNTWKSANGNPPAEGTTGLFHVAFLYERSELVSIYLKLKAAGIAIDELVHHGLSESIYVRDPDQNGVELYCDTPESEWRTPSGELKMGHRVLDPETFLK